MPNRAALNNVPNEEPAWEMQKACHHNENNNNNRYMIITIINEKYWTSAAIYSETGLYN